MWKFTPNGRSVKARVRSMAGPTSSGRITAQARKPNAPALQAAATNSGFAIHPIAVWMIG
jgi:hypothetical protein